VLESIRLLADAGHSFTEHCVVGLAADRERIAANLDADLMLVTALAPHVGYDTAAAIAKQAHRDGSTLREAALASGAVSADDYDRWVDPEAMTHPG
jgi:fumarate hydratase, class II